MKDYYDILGVAKDAGQDEIKKAYRNLAKKHHPDRNPGDASAEQMFKDANEAYETLGDAEKRKRYDSLREARSRGFSGFDGVYGDLFGKGGRGGRPRGGGREFRFEDLGDFRDLFGSFFDPGAFGGPGGGPGRAAPAKGQDRTFSIEVPFDVAVKGGSTSIRIPRHETCPTCGGSGAAPGSTPTPCENCGGSGQIQFQQGTFAFTRPCPACFGRGVRIQAPCATCSGSGTRQATRTLDVKIPKGVKTGARIRLRGEGDPGSNNGPPGDLFLQIRVGPHPGFRREGLNLHGDVFVNFSTATLGGKADVETYWGPATVSIPPGTRPGRQLRLKGQGIEDAAGRRGDHIATVRVRVPASLTDEQRRSVEALKKVGL